MDFSNEPYVRLYTRNTTTWRRLEWQGQCVMMQLLRVVDRAGVLDIEDMTPAEAVALHTGLPADVAEYGMARMLELSVCVHNGGALLFPRYLDAQESNKSDRQRQRESREKRRATAAEPVVTKSDTPSQNVTEGHGLSHAVTPSHTPSQAVTLTSALPVLCSTSAVLGSAAPDSDRAPANEVVTQTGPETTWRKPLPAMPADVRIDVTAAAPPPHVRIWRLYAQVLGTDVALLGSIDNRATTSIAEAVTAAVGASAGDEWDRTAQRLLAAWRADRYVQEKKPGLRNLADQLSRYLTVLQAKPLLAMVKADPEQQRARELAQARANLARHARMVSDAEARAAQIGQSTDSKAVVSFHAQHAEAQLRVLELEGNAVAVRAQRAECERLQAHLVLLDKRLEEEMAAILRGEAVAS